MENSPEAAGEAMVDEQVTPVMQREMLQSWKRQLFIAALLALLALLPLLKYFMLLAFRNFFLNPLKNRAVSKR